jgi:S-adenosylmethionine:tRNA ribosyltransferase-isomerase
VTKPYQLMSLNISDFDFHLPDELIAQEPSAVRGGSRLLVVDRVAAALHHTTFCRLPDWLREGDLLVLNNTKVFPARLLGHRVPSGGAVECLLLRRLPTSNTQLPEPDANVLGSSESGMGSSVWEALMHPGQKLRPGDRVMFQRGGHTLGGEVVGRHFHGRRTVRLWVDDGRDVLDAIDRIGHMPLPPYIKREDRGSDRERYQTVYAREVGSVAAPTAGLHFTSALLDALTARGVEYTEITLHVGYGTFKPIRTDRIDDHVVDPEAFVIPPGAAAALADARRSGRRIVAVGTTTVRALESLTFDSRGNVAPLSGDTGLFIRPGHEFRLVNGLITNFHLPRSSLLLLVSAFTGRERLLEAYREAIARNYRFYSYGDAMLVI